MREGISICFLLIVLQESAQGFVTLTPSMALSERYTDNFFFTEIEANREGDFTTTVGPQLTLSAENRNLNMSARYQGNAEFNIRHPEENRYGQTLSMDIVMPSISEIRGLDLHITESVAYVPELPAFSFGRSGPLPVEANQGIQVGRTDTFRNRAGVTLGYGWTSLFSTALSYSYLTNQYRGGTLEDYIVHQGGINGVYQVSRRMQWIASYDASVTNYEKADSVAVHNFHLSDRYQISPTFTASVGTGVAVIPGGETQWTLSAEVGETGPFRTLSFQYIRGIGTGGGVTTTATLSQNLVGQVIQTLSRSASATLRLGYGVNEALSGPAVKISTQEFGAGIQISFLSWLSGGVNYSYLNQRTDGGMTIQDAHRNLIMVNLTATALPLRIMQ